MTFSGMSLYGSLSFLLCYHSHSDDVVTTTYLVCLRSPPPFLTAKSMAPVNKCTSASSNNSFVEYQSTIPFPHPEQFLSPLLDLINMAVTNLPISTGWMQEVAEGVARATRPDFALRHERLSKATNGSFGLEVDIIVGHYGGKWIVWVGG